MQFLKSAYLIATLTAVLAGCASTKPSEPMPMAAAPAPQAPAPAPVAAAQPAPAPVMAAAVPAYLDPQNPLSTQRSVYFDFDKFKVKDEFVPVLAMHAKFLAANPTVSIKIEGNADERGSAEYNLALGQKRADAVAKVLHVYGVSGQQIETVSWGKEKPKASGHDAKSWAENRRSDIVYPAQ